MDYCLKCTSGAHKNKFIFINLTPEGELIGSSEEKATLFIENANLKEKHTQIIHSNGSYFVKDLSGTTGTWHKPGIFDEIQIEDKMEIKIFDEHFIFEMGGKLFLSRSYQRSYSSCVPEVRVP